MAASARLTEERKAWRQDPVPGFVAKPSTLHDGSQNLFEWSCAITGREGTAWHGGLYKVTLRFPVTYPAHPPMAYFLPVIFHPNVFSNGQVCLSILDENKDWKPSIAVRDVLLGLQGLLDQPNCMSPAQQEASQMYERHRAAYTAKIRKQALAMAPPPEED